MSVMYAASQITGYGLHDIDIAIKIPEEATESLPIACIPDLGTNQFPAHCVPVVFSAEKAATA
jgi:hypothetical protein